MRVKILKTVVFAFLSLLCFDSVFAQAANGQYGTIVAKVIAFRAAEGNIQLSLYDKEQKFPDLDMRILTKIEPVSNGSVVEVRFENLPFGTYAIAGLHDQNKSGNMDYNWLGLPKEGYCFSNNAKPVFSPPSFSQAKFKLDQKEKIVYITMQY